MVKWQAAKTRPEAEKREGKENKKLKLNVVKTRIDG